MATSTYTPGPWKLAAGRLIETTSGGFTIGREGWHGTPTELDANARIVAAAAELLEVLRRGSDAISALEADCDEAGIDCYPARHWWQDAERIIAKAEGRT